MEEAAERIHLLKKLIHGRDLWKDTDLDRRLRLWPQ